MVPSSDGREWLLPTLFDASLLTLQEPLPSGSFFIAGRAVRRPVDRSPAAWHQVALTRPDRELSGVLLERLATL